MGGRKGRRGGERGGRDGDREGKEWKGGMTFQLLRKIDR